MPSPSPIRVLHVVDSLGVGGTELALAKIIVEAQHGSIVLEDPPGAGTAFVIELPTRWPVEEPRRSE